MEKKPLKIAAAFFAVVIIVMALMIALKILKRTSGATIGADVIQLYETDMDLDAKAQIAQFTAEQTGLLELYNQWMNNPNQQEMSITILRGSLMQGNLPLETADILIAMGFDDNSVIIALEHNGSAYRFMHKVDNFFTINALQLMPLKTSGKDILVVREEADLRQLSGEMCTFLRGYYYHKGEFKLVLNIVEDYKAYWNSGSDGNTVVYKIHQNSNTAWESGIYPCVKLAAQQSIAQQPAAETITEDNFDVIGAKEISRTWFWSNDYNSFILYLAVDAQTGEEVAIIEDMADSPYSLTNNQITGYRILRRNGKVELLDWQRVKDINKAPIISGV